MDAYQTILLTVAREHGHRAKAGKSGSIDIWIAWTKPDTGERGEDKFNVSSLRELKLVLGY
jgi:hypothetical protein